MAAVNTAYLLDVNSLQQLYDHLKSMGELIAPQIWNGVLSYKPSKNFTDLPFGWSEQQGPGTYKLTKTGRSSIFAYRVAPTSWKPFLYPPKELIFTAQKSETGVTIKPAPIDQQSRILFGVRPCELRAIRIQEKVFAEAEYESYQKRLKNCIIVAVACVTPGENCFCTDLNSGPDVKDDCDLNLIEWASKQKTKTQYLIKAGSETGRKILEVLSFPLATLAEIEEAEGAVSQAAQKMGRSLDVSRGKDLLIRQHDNYAFEEIATRCTACGNCTLVCPTCFCSNLEDHTSLDGLTAERVRTWDSCFTLDFTYIHGGYARENPPERYRQWITHKLSNWETQFEEAGCVGCGRCITWCPEGIDITVEFNLLIENRKEPAIRYKSLT